MFYKRKQNIWTLDIDKVSPLVDVKVDLELELVRCILINLIFIASISKRVVFQKNNVVFIVQGALCIKYNDPQKIEKSILTDTVMKFFPISFFFLRGGTG